MRARHEPDTNGGESPAATGTEGGPDGPGAPDLACMPVAVGQALRIGLVFGVMALAAVVVIAGWLTSQLQTAADVERQRAQLLTAGREGAVLLTTIRHTNAEAEAEQILDSATGVFLEDFRTRSQSFLDTVERAQSDTAGTVVAAGLESVRGGHANVLVVISVETSLAGTAAPTRLWRMRIGVQQVGEDTKVSDVEFLP